MKLLPVVLLFALAACTDSKIPSRNKIDLKGEWQFAIDTADTGVRQQWYLSDLNDSISLPGTMDMGKKGFQNHDTTTLHLARLYKYEGAAWYRKKIIIPENYKDKHLVLFFERSKTSRVWIDSMYIGESQLLQSPQQYDVSASLSPGEHWITVQVNNDRRLTPYGNVHIYSDDTQTNWNGIVGEMYIEASPKTFISDLQVYPDISNKKAGIVLTTENGNYLKDLDIKILVEKTMDGKTTQLKTEKFTVPYESIIKLNYQFDESPALWDEFKQPLYHLTAVISGSDIADAKTISFGMRKFAVNGTQFTINGNTIFLRGKHDGGVSPLTGFPSMNVEDWVNTFKIAKSYGINHYRFHSYCPPEAAFTAADQEGIYIQAELPFWGGLNSDSIAGMLKQEGAAMLKAYANHPSFVLFSPGNEIWGGHDKIAAIVKSYKVVENRMLFTMGSNNNIGYLAPPDYADYFVGARIPDHGDSTIGQTRLTQAFADAKDGAILNTTTPSTEINFDYAVGHMKIPLVSHEVGQYQVYPDYKEIKKYTGVLRAWNLEVFKKRLEEKGMTGMDSLFQKASGAWSALCYKAEMEAALRTKGMAGFQLLDLQDYPGQGTALVGMLDAFMDSKHVVTPEVWKQSCNDVVPLLEFQKYCWTNNESFKARVEVANYSDKTFSTGLDWNIQKKDGSFILKGHMPVEKIEKGGLFFEGEFTVALFPVTNPEELTVHISIPGTEYSNIYPVWVYPAKETVKVPDDILVTESLSPSVLSSLNNGARVLLFPQTADIKNKSFPGLFPPDFWNYGMFKSISEGNKKPISPGTLGILTNPGHPLFNSFPTDPHTNWQWFSIINASNSLILDSLPHNYLPIVQVIDNLERNDKLGLIFEFKCGKGKLLVCMSQLNKLMDKPEAVQLYQSILNYMHSENFNPAYEPSTQKLNALLTQTGTK